MENNKNLNNKNQVASDNKSNNEENLRKVVDSLPDDVLTKAMEQLYEIEKEDKEAKDKINYASQVIKNNK